MFTPSLSSRRCSALAMLGVLALGACSSSDASSVVDPAAGLTTDLPAELTIDPPVGTAVDSGLGGDVIDVADAQTAPGGSCAVSLSGATTVSYTSGGGVMAVASDYWLPEGVVSPLEPVALLITCADAASGALVSIFGDSEQVAFAPGSYVVPSLQLGVFLPDSILQTSDPATITIEAFDASHVVGNLAATVTDSSGAASDLTVQFDLANPLASG